MRKPVILMSTNTLHEPDLKRITGDTHILYSDVASAHAVMAAGGLPLYVPAVQSMNAKQVDQYLELADGVLLTGADSAVSPLSYHESPRGFIGRIDDDRDRLDLQLVKKAYKKKLPLFGICKGAEIINVALCGTLYQHVEKDHPNCINHQIRKSDRSNNTHLLSIAPGTMAHAFFGKTHVQVNGGHKQAIKKLAPCLRMSAEAEDGIVEMFEAKNGQFVLGVQFHPELKLSERPFKKMFEHFIRASLNHI